MINHKNEQMVDENEWLLLKAGVSQVETNVGGKTSILGAVHF